MEVFGLNLSHTFSRRLDFASEIPFQLSPVRRLRRLRSTRKFMNL